MTHTRHSPIATLTLVVITAGFAHAADDASAAAPSVTILPGEISSARFAEGVPDQGFDPAWEWQALVCRKKCHLETVKLLMTPVQVSQYDGEPLPGHTYAFDHELDAPPLLLLRGLPLEARARPVTYLHGALDYPPASTPGTMDIDIPSPNGELARIVPRYAGLIDGTPWFKIYLETKTGRQLLRDLAVDVIAGPAEMARGPQLLRWAGDLDGDGKLDLVMSFDSRVGTGAAATLFLSSAAKPGELVGQVANFNYWPMGHPSC